MGGFEVFENRIDALRCAVRSAHVHKVHEHSPSCDVLQFDMCDAALCVPSLVFERPCKAACDAIEELESRWQAAEGR
jgi:hypothetical protein